MRAGKGKGYNRVRAAHAMPSQNCKLKYWKNANGCFACSATHSWILFQFLLHRHSAGCFLVHLRRTSFQVTLIMLLLRLGTGAAYCDQPVCLCVCSSVCPRAYLWNRWTDRHEILCADPLWPWLDPPPVALRYVMYFRFYGWRHSGPHERART